MFSPDLFHSDTVHQRTVKLFDGTEHTLHFRELTDAEYRRVQRVGRDPDPEVQESHRTLMLHLSVCSPDGAPALSFEQADRLKPVVKDRLYLVALEVNGFATKADAGNDSAPGERSGSGTSSPSHSAAEPSGSGSA